MKIITLACFLILNTLISDGQDLSEYEGFRKYKSVKLKSKHFDSVKYLDLSYRKLREVPLFIKHLKNLKVLDLSGNRLTFKEDMMLPQSIEVLILTNNNLNRIPQFIFSLKQLKKLYLLRNNIESINGDFSKLLNLEILNLGFNKVDNYDVGPLKKQIPNCRIVTTLRY